MEKVVRNYRLPATDLANLLFRDHATKRGRLLELIQPKVIPYTYNPFRRTVGDAINLQFDLPGLEMVPTPWDLLEKEVTKACRGRVPLIDVNLPVARATHQHALERGITAGRLDSSPLRLAAAQSYSFWMPILLEAGGRFFVTYPEPRRKAHLSPLGMQVVMSAQHERFRAAGMGLEDIGLEIWRYTDQTERQIKVYNDIGLDLIPYAELASETADVYNILYRLLFERDEELKRSSHLRTGPLL